MKEAKNTDTYNATKVPDVCFAIPYATRYYLWTTKGYWLDQAGMWSIMWHNLKFSEPCENFSL